jgi:hypothetical protein
LTPFTFAAPRPNIGGVFVVFIAIAPRRGEAFSAVNDGDAVIAANAFRDVKDGDIPAFGAAAANKRGEQRAATTAAITAGENCGVWCCDGKKGNLAARKAM